jgi:secreted PhoX family phosphatase
MTWTLFLLGTLAVGCSSDTQSPSGETGSLSLQLELGNGATVNTVEWVITRGGMDPMNGTIDTGAPGATASIEVFGLEPGDGYRITMTAQATDEETRCTGDTDFSVTAGQATEIMVILSCKTPPRLGAVRANGKFNICTELAKMIVSPLETSVGGTIDLSAIGEDAEGDDFEYLWTAEGGTVADPSAADTTFTCDTEGEGFVAVTVSDDGFDYCDSGTWTVAVTCVGDGGGTGGAGGSAGAGGAGGTGGGDPTDSIATRPLSSMMAVSLEDGSGFDNIPDFTKDLVDRYANGETIDGFPLAVPSRDADVAGVLDGLTQNVVVKWFDAITPDNSPGAPRFGSNNDYLAYFGDGWDSDWTEGVVGSGPMFGGSADAAWVWSNHEYISNNVPQPATPPTGQYETLATFLASNALLPITDPTDPTQWTQEVVDEHIVWEKRQHGGSWFRVERQEGGRWELVPDESALRYDSTDSTLAFITGYTPAEVDNDDSGNALPAGVAVGITADCSGGQTPWGTIFTAEENAQSQWGDLESTYVSDRQFVLDNASFGKGQNINPNFEAAEDSEFGRSSDENGKHNRDIYGFLVEIDPGVAPETYYQSVADGGDGVGHRKLGSMGRARWENMDTVTDADQKLVDGQKVVFYAANDRRAGRVYKWVSKDPYMAGMTRGQVRALLDEGDLYVGHWGDLDSLTGLTKYDPEAEGWENCAGDAILNGDDEGTAVTVRENCPALTEESPGQGVWIKLSVDNTDQEAPNAAALGAGTTVGAALQDVNWNGVGGYADDNDVLSALFTAAQKLGVRELNRPEDVEWNPVDKSLYVAFTYHGRTIGMKQDGTLIYRNTNGDPVDIDGNVLDPGEPLAERGIANLHTFQRADNFGSIYKVMETNSDNPAESTTFTFYPVFFGSQGDTAFDTARPDNLSIDEDGGVWFGTDGNTSGSTNASADGIHYLDLDPAHKEGQPGIVNPTYGLGFRILHSANDAEATGPAWNSTQDTIFYNAQHPGEGRASAWPSSQPDIN